MRAHLPVGVTKGFECGNLTALQRDQTREDDIEQESRDKEKDHWHDRCQRLKLLQFSLEHVIRGLFIAPNSAHTTIRCQQTIQVGEHLRWKGSRLQTQANVIKA